MSNPIKGTTFTQRSAGMSNPIKAQPSRSGAPA